MVYLSETVFDSEARLGVSSIKVRGYFLAPWFEFFKSGFWLSLEGMGCLKLIGHTPIPSYQQYHVPAKQWRLFMTYDFISGIFSVGNETQLWLRAEEVGLKIDIEWLSSEVWSWSSLPHEWRDVIRIFWCTFMEEGNRTEGIWLPLSKTNWVHWFKRFN